MNTIAKANALFLVGLLGAAACSSDNKTHNTYVNPYDTGGSGAGGPSTSSSQWVKDSYVPGTLLMAIWGSSANDIWAVGQNSNFAHWNGSGWSTLQQDYSGSFKAVWGSGSNDVWAVGGYSSVMRWDGTAWKPYTLPDNINFHEINGIWGSGANDVWIVGNGGADESKPQASTPAVIHWDGSTWSPLQVQGPADLKAVWGSGPNDVWAVGGYSTGLITHWDGQAWSIKRESSAGSVLTELDSVWGSGPSDVWAVGPNNMAHYDGTDWTVYLCSSAAYYAESSTVCPYAMTKVWAAGKNDVWTNNYLLEVKHWDGTAWATSRGAGGPEAIWGASSVDVWAVGASIAHYKP